MTARTLVLGIGNTLLRDEGAGVRAVAHMRDAHPDPDIEYVDGGTLSFTLSAYIDEAVQMIVIDAADFGGAPGEHRCFVGPEMDRFLAGPVRSVHEVSLADLLDISRLRGRLPDRRALFGIQPDVVCWGDGLSPEVERAVSDVADSAARLIGEWRALL